MTPIGRIVLVSVDVPVSLESALQRSIISSSLNHSYETHHTQQAAFHIVCIPPTRYSCMPIARCHNAVKIVTNKITVFIWIRRSTFQQHEFVTPGQTLMFLLTCGSMPNNFHQYMCILELTVDHLNAKQLPPIHVYSRTYCGSSQWQTTFTNTCVF